MTKDDNYDYECDDYEHLIIVPLQNLRLYSLWTGNSSQEEPVTERKIFFPRQINTDRLVAEAFKQTGRESPLSQYWLGQSFGKDGNYLRAENFTYADVTTLSQK